MLDLKNMGQKLQKTYVGKAGTIAKKDLKISLKKLTFDWLKMFFLIKTNFFWLDSGQKRPLLIWGRSNPFLNGLQ